MPEQIKLIEGTRCPFSDCGSVDVGVFPGGLYHQCVKCKRLLWERRPDGQLIEWRREFLGPPVIPGPNE